MDNEFLSRQLIKLGDMMGDGLHYEPGGEWITKEYNRILRLLHPEIFAEKRKQTRDRVNVAMNKLLEVSKCSCGGSLRQSRSGSRIAYCKECGIRYKAGKSKK